MAKLDEYIKACEKIEPNKRIFIISLLKDYAFIEEQIDDLRKYPRYAINADNPKLQIRLEVHNMLKDYQAQKNDIATKVLKALEDQEGGESDLIKLLKGFEK